MKNKMLNEIVAEKMIELYGSTLTGKALDKAAIDCYCDICKFSKNRILLDYDYDNISDAISAYHEIK
jgi:hypothetical protein